MRPGEEGGRRGAGHAGRAHGRGRGGGGRRVPRPRPHLPQDRAQAQRGRRGGEAEGQGRDDPAREAPRAGEAGGQGPGDAGEGLPRGRRRPQRAGLEGVRPEAGGREPHGAAEEPPYGGQAATAAGPSRPCRRGNKPLCGATKAPGYAGGLLPKSMLLAISVPHSLSATRPSYPCRRYH